MTYDEVFKWIKSLKNDTSTGPDLIPAKFIKLVPHEICSPLTHIINSFIAAQRYPYEWKLSRVCPIGKIPNPVEKGDYRPISILPVLSKIFEKIVLQQLLEHIESHNIYKDTLTGFRKSYSTGNALLKLRDDIKKSMNAREITIVVLVDFSKAFDTIAHDVLISKMHKQGFSKSFLKWTMSYLSNRRQFVQIDANKSTELPTSFGVPQGSILGPIFFNLYVNDLPDFFTSNSVQYADDTTLYESGKPTNVPLITDEINATLNSLHNWSIPNSLATNCLKTKYMICGTSNLIKLHSTKLADIQIKMGEKVLKEVVDPCLLGLKLDRNLKWDNHIRYVLSSCYGKLTVLRKLKNFTPFHLRKHLAEALILSRIDFNDHVYSPLSAIQ